MIRWITYRLGTAPASSEAITDDLVRVDVRDLVDKHGNSPEAVRSKIDQGVALLRGGARVVVCCDYGISRSNAVAAGVLARVEGIPLAEAVRRVRETTGEKEIKLEPLNAVRAALGEARPATASGRPRLLVTGGTGFVGRKLVAALESEADILSIGSEVDLASGPLALDLLAQEHGADQIVHLASPRVYTSNRAMGDTLSMLRNVLDVCRSTGARLVFVSSWEIYSGYRAREIVAGESLPALPKGPYGETKMLCEQLLAHHRETHGLDLTILRSSPAYGGGSDKPKFLYNFARKAAEGAAVIRTHRYANAVPMLDLLHVNDLVAAIRAVILRSPSGDFNVGGGRLWGTAEIARRLVELNGGATVVEEQPVEDEVANVLMDSARARQLLDWAPAQPFDAYLPRLVRGESPPAPPRRGFPSNG